MRNPTQSLILTISILTCLLANFGRAQEVSSDDLPKDPDQRVVLRLSQTSLDSLSETGFAKAIIPVESRNRVNSFKLVSDENFLKQTIPMTVDVLKDSNNVLIINLTDDQVNQIRFQPVTFSIYERGFVNILLRNTTLTGSKSGAPDLSPASKELSERKFYFRKTATSGAFAVLDFPELRLRNGYGEHSIPLAVIAAVLVNGSNDVLVYLNNGNKISGQIDLNHFNLGTPWGTHRLPTSDLFSITRTRSQQFIGSMVEGTQAYLLYDSKRPQAIGY